MIALVTLTLSGGLARADLLDDKQAELRNLQKQIEEQEKALEKIRNQRLTLDNQVQLLDKQIESARLTLEAIGVEMEAITLEKSAVNKDLVDLEEQALEQKLVMKQAIKASYLSGRESLMEILIGADSLADFMSHLEYLDRVQHHISVGIKTLLELKDQLATKKAILEDKDQRFTEIQSAKLIEEQSLGIQIEAKESVLFEVKSSETTYQAKLDEARAQQQAVSNEISNLLSAKNRGIEIKPGDLKLAWPIPYRTITATFRDQDYAARFGLQHYAIDIAAPQGTPIKAPYDGVVSKVKDGGARGLSYIIVDHTNGLSTVYLHLSAFAVSTGAFVVQGQTIGYVGGTPGTPGAGYLTTGPHLHFEVWYDGQARNPLAYLV